MADITWINPKQIAAMQKVRHDDSIIYVFHMSDGNMWTVSKRDPDNYLECLVTKKMYRLSSDPK
jgi:hypothetical protein